MARIVKLLSAFSIVLFLASCASTASIETNKNSAYDQVITKLYVVVDVGDWRYDEINNVPLGDYLKANIVKRLEEDRIDTKATRVTDLEIGQDQLEEQITDFGADRVMMVQLTHGLTKDNKLLLDGTFDISVLDASDKSVDHYPVVWRGKVTTDRGLDADTVIDSIISGLQKDGLIAAPAAPAKSS